MRREEYLQTVNNLKQEGHHTMTIGSIVLGAFGFMFICPVVYSIAYVLTTNTEVSLLAGLGAYIAWIIGLIIYQRYQNKRWNQNVMEIYAKEIPVECPNCAGHFTVIAGNAEECPYCKTSVLVDNTGRIVNRKTDNTGGKTCHE